MYRMYYKVGEIRPYVVGKYVQKGKILEVHEEDETYLIEDLETKEQHVVDEDDVFIGDD